MDRSGSFNAKSSFIKQFDKSLLRSGTFKAASLNTTGLPIGRREEVEQWMDDREIDVLLIHETNCDHSKIEVRGRYTWYFGGADRGSFTHYGVGIVLKNI